MISYIKDNVILIDGKFILKKDSIVRLKAEKYFIKKYKGKIKLEELLESNLKEGYNVYKFIDGKEISNYKDVDDCLTEVYKIIEKYEDIYEPGYGFIYDLKKSWTDFLKDEVDRNIKYIKYNKYKMLKIVYEKLDVLDKYNLQKKLIHGDLGGFNIICNNKKIVGIIDPRVIIGDPIYDLIYFIFSSYNICKGVKLKEVFNILKGEEKEKILAMMYIILFNRISIEEKYHTKAKGLFYYVWNELANFEETIYVGGKNA